MEGLQRTVYEKLTEDGGFWKVYRGLFVEG